MDEKKIIWEQYGGSETTENELVNMRNTGVGIIYRIKSSRTYKK